MPERRCVASAIALTEVQRFGCMCRMLSSLVGRHSAMLFGYCAIRADGLRQKPIPTHALPLKGRVFLASSYRTGREWRCGTPPPPVDKDRTPTFSSDRSRGSLMRKL